MMRNILLELISKNTENPDYGFGELNEDMITKMKDDELSTVVKHAVDKRQA